MVTVIQRIIVTVIAGLLAFTSFSAQAKIRVFACEPEWGSLVEELAGDQAKVFVATTAQQDPHHIEARPSLIAKMRRADIAVCSGAELETGWLPLLLRSSGNKKVQINQPGYFEAASFVNRLEIPTVIDRSLGDIHASGNPHVHLDPHRLLIIAAALSKRLGEIDSGAANHYQQRYDDFSKRWQAATEQWQQRAASLRGAEAIVHHRDWSYLFSWLGIKEVAQLEPKPGVPPSAAHLAKLKQQLANSPPQFIIYGPHQSAKAANWLAKQTGSPALQLPYTVGGDKQANDLFSLFDVTLNKLLTTIP